MNATNPETEEKDNQDAEHSFLNSVRNWIITLWVDFRQKIHTAKFVVEVLAVIGLAFYTGVALLQWNATRQTLRLDQRPWITPKASGQLQLQIGQRIGQDLYFQNTGKTAALDVKAEVKMRILKEGEELNFDYSRQPATITTPVLWQNDPTPPQTLLINESPTQATIFTQELAQQYANRKIEIVRYGRITYSDIWGLWHKTTFCKSDRAPDPSNIIYMSTIGTKCTAYSSVDKNY